LTTLGWAEKSKGLALNDYSKLSLEEFLNEAHVFMN